MRHITSILSITYKRLTHSLGLTLSALVGIVCVLTLAICIPVFAYAVSGQLLRDQLFEQAEKSGHPVFSIRAYSLYDSQAPMDIASGKQISELIPQRVSDLLGIQPETVIVEFQSAMVELRPAPQPDAAEWSVDAGLVRRLKFATQTGLTEHAQLLDGEWPAPGKDSGALEVAVHEDLANTVFLNVGQVYTLSNGVEVKIVAIWREINDLDPYWYESPGAHFKDLMWLPTDIYYNRVGALMRKPISFASWFLMVNFEDVRFQNARQYTSGMIRLDNELHNLGVPVKMDYSPLNPLLTYQERVTSMTNLLYAVAAPLVVLGLIFIGLTSAIVIQEYEGEVAMLRSRGISRREILVMNLMESLLLLIVSLPVAIAIGWLAANAMGQTESFLRFTSRPAISFSANGLNLLALGGASILVVLSRLLPTWNAARFSIIKHKAEQSRSETKTSWQRYNLDFLLLLVSAYTYLSLRGWGNALNFVYRTIGKVSETLSSEAAPASVEPYRDPLLFVAPAVFAAACCMISIRLIPLIARGFEALLRRSPGVWHYLSLQQIARRPQDYSNALLLIMISLSLAIFSATAAKTLDQWLYDSIHYATGADLVVWEYAPAPSGVPSSVPGPVAAPETAARPRNMPTASGITLADLGGESEWAATRAQHLKYPGVRDLTRVGRYHGQFASGAVETEAEVIGIDRLEFPNVAFFRDDFASVPLGGLMNALGADSTAMLIPRELAESQSLQIGDVIAMNVAVLDQIYPREFVVAGIFDYFPTVFPGRSIPVVVNLEAIFGNPDSIIDYNIWMSLEADANTAAITRAIFEETGLIAAVQGDAASEVHQEQAGIERVGLFGILNVGFFTAGIMPAIGFILYSYASIRRRFIQLGILQAIGLSLRQLVGYLVSEQLFLMSFAILGGAGIGLLASNIFVPFLQAEVQPTPPFLVFSGLGEAAWLSLVFAIVLLLTLAGTISSLARMKVFQAIKMGESL